MKKSSFGSGLNLERSEAKFSLSLYTAVPLQLTLTKVSLVLLKSLAEVSASLELLVLSDKGNNARRV